MFYVETPTCDQEYVSPYTTLSLNNSLFGKSSRSHVLIHVFSTIPWPNIPKLQQRLNPWALGIWGVLMQAR